MLPTILPPVPEQLYHRSQSSSTSVQIRYLGTAGFVISSPDRTLVLDPFITRPDVLSTLLYPLMPNPTLVRQVIPRADDVLIGHSHHDHVLDAPCLCKQTGARLIGSEDACNVGRAAGLPESQLVSTSGREDIVSGDAIIRGVPSLHGRIFGHVPLPGPIPVPPAWPAKVTELRCGLVLNWHIRIGGVSIMHIDSADFIDAEFAGLNADIVCLCAIGRNYRPNYLRSVVELLKPKVIIPCHWDWFFSPYYETPKCLPGVDLEGFTREIAAADVQPVLLPFDGVYGA